MKVALVTGVAGGIGFATAELLLKNNIAVVGMDVSPEMPKTIFYNSMASNELIAHTIALKYLHAMPLYRQQSYFDMMGATLSRQTLCNWTMSAAKALDPIYNYMKKELLNRNYIHANETTLKVINDNGKSSKSKKYMWLYMSETNAKPIILYDYQNTRSSSCPKAFLGEYSGYLQTDGYSGYNSVSEATRLYCLAHIRRKFYEIVENLDKEALKKSRGVIGFNYCEQIYKLEKELRETYSSNEDYYDIRFNIRKEKLEEIAFIGNLNINLKLVSKLDGTRKYLFELNDGNIIESVMMEYEHGVTVCISNQVGCRMGCRFCASTLEGLPKTYSPTSLRKLGHEGFVVRFLDGAFI